LDRGGGGVGRFGGAVITGDESVVVEIHVHFRAAAFGVGFGYFGLDGLPGPRRRLFDARLGLGWWRSGLGLGFGLADGFGFRGWLGRGLGGGGFAVGGAGVQLDELEDLDGFGLVEGEPGGADEENEEQ
jgi:hypothetical protein